MRRRERIPNIVSSSAGKLKVKKSVMMLLIKTTIFIVNKCYMSSLLVIEAPASRFTKLTSSIVTLAIFILHFFMKARMR